MILPPRRAADPRLGTSNSVKVPAATDIVGAAEGGGELVRVGVRFSGTGVLEVW
jgi:hypothetical protein